MAHIYFVRPGFTSRGELGKRYLCAEGEAQMAHVLMAIANYSRKLWPNDPKQLAYFSGQEPYVVESAVKLMGSGGQLGVYEHFNEHAGPTDLEAATHLVADAVDNGAQIVVVVAMSPAVDRLVRLVAKHYGINFRSPITDWLDAGSAYRLSIIDKSWLRVNP